MMIIKPSCIKNTPRCCVEYATGIYNGVKLRTGAPFDRRTKEAKQYFIGDRFRRHRLGW